MPPTETSSGLTSLFNDLGGDDWKEKANWLQGAPCTDEWSRLQCCADAAPAFDPDTNLCSADGGRRRLSEDADSLSPEPVRGAACKSSNTESGNVTGTVADLEVCQVVAIDLKDNRLNGRLNLSHLCDLPNLARLDVSNTAGCGEDCNVFTSAEGSCEDPLSLTHVDLTNSRLSGDFPWSLFTDVQVLKMSGNTFTYPETDADERAFKALVDLCSLPQTSCEGLPPSNCNAFGRLNDDGTVDEGTYYKPRVDNPSKCIRCSNPLTPVLLISIACGVMMVMLFVYIALIRKYRLHLKRWVSTVAIIATHFQTVSIVGNLHLHWPPPVEAVTGLATLSVFENTQIFRPECLVEDRGISTFYLFSILVAGGILFVLLGGLIAVFFLLCIRRVRYGPPGLTINNTGRYSAKCYKEEFEEESRRVSRVSSGARSSGGRSSASASGARGSEDSDGVREVRESTVTFSASLSPVEGSGSLPPPLPAPPPPSHCFAATTTTMTVSFSASGASDFTRDQIDGIKAAFASELDDGAVDVQVKVVHRHVRRALRRVWGICTQFTRGSLSAVEDTTVEVTLRKIGVGDIDAFKAKLSARLGLDERSSAADDEPGAGASLFLKERGLRASSGAEVAVTSAPIVETPAGRLDDLLDNICFVQTVFFSMQIATSWRVSLKMLVKGRAAPIRERSEECYRPLREPPSARCSSSPSSASCCGTTWRSATRNGRGASSASTPTA